MKREQAREMADAFGMWIARDDDGSYIAIDVDGDFDPDTDEGFVWLDVWDDRGVRGWKLSPAEAKSLADGLTHFADYCEAEWDGPTEAKGGR